MGEALIAVDGHPTEETHDPAARRAFWDWWLNTAVRTAWIATMEL
jgi:hypothetical protein